MANAINTGNRIERGPIAGYLQSLCALQLPWYRCRASSYRASIIPLKILCPSTIMKIAIVGPRLAAATTLALLFASTGLAASPPSPPTPAAAEDKLQSEFLFDLALEAQMPNNLATANGGRLIVPISGGTFAGPRLKGTIVPPSGDWVGQRPDGSRILDVRILLQTDDGQKIYMSWRGIAYAPPGGALWARIVPMFETASEKNAWLNNVVAVGVYRPDLGKIAYRVYRIL